MTDTIYTPTLEEKPQVFRLLVCGGRDFADGKALRRWMNEAVSEHKHVLVIHGGARGADALAGQIAKQAGIGCQVFPALWEKHGRSAGPIRNQQMLDEGKPDLVLAAPGGVGTADMVRRSRAADVAVLDKRS